MSVKDRGFASMDPGKRSEISRLGGLAVQDAGTGHKWTKKTAKEAGKIGGIRSGEARRAKKG